ncbi:hypothetical protein cypCar_00003455, partial [Cyprinus carpio]
LHDDFKDIRCRMSYDLISDSLQTTVPLLRPVSTGIWLTLNGSWSPGSTPTPGLPRTDGLHLASSGKRGDLLFAA